MSSPTFFLRSRAQSDGKTMQVRKVNEEGLGRGTKKLTRNRASVTELRRRKRLLVVYKSFESWFWDMMEPVNWFCKCKLPCVDKLTTGSRHVKQNCHTIPIAFSF